MEPNEMERYSMFATLGVWDFKESPTGEWVRYSDAMQIITALQEKIDGMIKRPVVEVGRCRNGFVLKVQGQHIFQQGDDVQNAYHRLLDSLGMEEGKL